MGLVPGVAVAIHYNPRRPTDAVLCPGTNVATLVFLALGILCIVSGLKA